MTSQNAEKRPDLGAADEIERLRRTLLEIRGHLYAAHIQGIASDDQIIAGHIRDALILAGGRP